MLLGKPQISTLHTVSSTHSYSTHVYSVIQKQLSSLSLSLCQKTVMCVYGGEGEVEQSIIVLQLPDTNNQDP